MVFFIKSGGKGLVKGYLQAAPAFPHLFFLLAFPIMVLNFFIMIKGTKDCLCFKATENTELKQLGSGPHSL